MMTYGNKLRVVFIDIQQAYGNLPVNGATC